MTKTQLEELFSTESAQLEKLNSMVRQSVEEEKLLTDKLKELEEQHPGFQARIADKVASFGGSWRFILSFTFLMLLWIGLNIFLLSRPFDPYPFILLNLLLSTVAALQAPVIMMSQNRKEEKDRQRAISDYMINLKSEIEVRNLHCKLDLLMTEQMQTLFEIQKTQIEMMEDMHQLLMKIKKEAD
jgi:uncharacterized membrane protein